jgi:Ran GTPase-activating protein (RanGAP) involved in mRNA processing and transport
MVWMI